jgi:glycerate 2-kinase
METPNVGDTTFERVNFQIVARNADAIAAAGRAARELGARSVCMPGALRGEARRMARLLVAVSRSIACDEPVCLIAGGETTVRLKGTGLGGRNQELALAAAIELAAKGDARIVLLSVGTDGTDGPTTAAGAWADSGTVVRGRTRGVIAQESLEQNDSHNFFAREGGLLITGPTGTNVMDLVLSWISPIPNSRG